MRFRALAGAACSLTVLLIASVTLVQCDSQQRAASVATPSPEGVGAAPTTSSVVSPAPKPAGATRDPSWPPYEYPASAPYPGGAQFSRYKSGYTANCWLPVVGHYGAYVAEFFEMPPNQVVGDITDFPSVPPPPAGFVMPSGRVGSDFGLSYDRAYKLWLPVPWNWIAPDGRHYAYAYADVAGILVADVSSGNAAAIATDKVWNIVDVESSVVYAQVQGSPGLWYVPFSGQPIQVTTAGYWQAANGRQAYGDMSPTPTAGNTISRLDLAAVGTAGINNSFIQPWFKVDGAISTVLGFDSSGTPIVKSQGSDQLIWLVPAPDQAHVIEASDLPYGITNWGQPIADKKGIWFIAHYQIYVYVPGDGTYTIFGLGIADDTRIGGTCG